ncbi:cell division protein FtsA [Novosphingobium sp.]|uniref:cell division protein FtsA n=1 Tax=Novosphingobium sp. TaxID=1874826 RepID=UPI0022C9E69B|nr:cell division protein FtsA [Novosphingobium sp.]MCZ8019303.1 cell division protein FtsA [Novosphingobium sp.]MCZ8035118.1 cell division protein FtsA [Novosphingobium sp.]MCZ8050432.1 cell division protein FtsA [Novosphingobium sp.]MCZ8058778.1 cell division protein FtsA [Novosphingobium sp.]MCZ8232223.1 cell division protein FtsA [Novosphingobium sp.]
MAPPRIARVFGAVNIGSFRVSAMIAGISETGEMVVLGSGHRAAQGIKRGYVTDMQAATYAVRDAVERAEKMANTSIGSVWIGASGAGLASQVAQVEIDIGGRQIEEDDIEHLLVAARDVVQPDGRMVLHAQPAHYTLDGADGVADPKGLHAERLGVDVHVMLADGAPVRNITEAVQNAHLQVEAVVASPIAAGFACLNAEERDLGVALVEFGAEVTNVSVYAAGMLLGLVTIPIGSGDVTDAIASAFGIRRFQAERLKCVHGSAIASPADHREMIPVNAPGDETTGPLARHADDKNRIPRAELISVITGEVGRLMEEVSRALKALGFTGQRGQQVVLTGGGAELAGLADYAQSALGKPVRIGRPQHLKGLAEAHATPGFSTLAGLVLYAAADPIDIRAVGKRYQPTMRYSGLGLVHRVYRAMREYF